LVSPHNKNFSQAVSIYGGRIPEVAAASQNIYA